MATKRYAAAQLRNILGPGGGTLPFARQWPRIVAGGAQQLSYICDHGSRSRAGSVRWKSNTTAGNLSFKQRMSALERELRELELEAQTDVKLDSQDPELESLLSEEDIDAFFEALQIPEERTPEQEKEASRLELQQARDAVSRAPSLFSPAFRAQVAEHKTPAQQAQLLESLWARLTDAEARHRRIDGLPGPLQATAHDDTARAQPPGADALASSTSQLEAEADAEAVQKIADLSALLTKEGMLQGDISLPELASLGTAAALHNHMSAFAKAWDVAEHFDALSPDGKAVRNLVESAVKALSHHGQAEGLLHILEQATKRGLEMTDEMRHSLVSLFVRQGDLPKALSTLRAFEQDKPAPVKSYTSLIRKFLRSREASDHEKAWDLFYHMRLAAHSVPDAQLYSAMIRAAASGRLPKRPGSTQVQGQGERALDLFREMTVGYQLRPSVDAFNATIFACARTPDLYGQALHLFKQMIELQDSGSTLYTPDQDAFNSLLAGCARNGDLARAKWIISEMLRLARAFTEEIEEQGANVDRNMAYALARLPDERTLTLLLLTYAAYKPPASRKAIQDRLQGRTDRPQSGQHSDVEVDGQHVSEALTTDRAEQDITSTAERSTTTTSASLLPQTRPEVVAEVVKLFQSVSDAMERRAETPQSAIDIWMKVQPTAALINAYLQVLARHLAPAQRMLTVHAAATEPGANNLFDRFSLKPTWPTLDLVLRLCVAEPNRHLADATADQLWSQNSQDVTNDPAAWWVWLGYVRHLAKSRHLRKAVDELQAFVQKHPPISRSYLEAHRPTQAECKAMITDITTGARAAPTFRHFDIPHHRLIDAGDKDGIELVTWAGHSYANQTKVIEAYLAKIGVEGR